MYFQLQWKCWTNRSWGKKRTTFQLRRCKRLFWAVSKVRLTVEAVVRLENSIVYVVSQKGNAFGEKHSELLDEYLLKVFLCTQQWRPNWIMFFLLHIWYLRVINYKDLEKKCLRYDGMCSNQKVRGTIDSRCVVRISVTVIRHNAVFP